MPNTPEELDGIPIFDPEELDAPPAAEAAMGEDEPLGRYDVCKAFSEGFAAAIRPEHRDATKSPHWLAGWDAGYRFRKEKNRCLDEYLVSIGQKPQAIIRPCDTPPPPAGKTPCSCPGVCVQAAGGVLKANVYCRFFPPAANTESAAPITAGKTPGQQLATATQRAEAAEAKAAKLEAALVSRHGGEPLALLEELDEARQQLAEERQLRRDWEANYDRMKETAVAAQQQVERLTDGVRVLCGFLEEAIGFADAGGLSDVEDQRNSAMALAEWKAALAATEGHQAHAALRAKEEG